MIVQVDRLVIDTWSSTMNIKISVAVALALLFVACDKKEDSTPLATAEHKTNVIEAIPAQQEMAVDAATATIEKPAAVEPAINETVAEAGAGSPVGAMLLTKTDALDLANKSGCLACHSVEKKVVGPAWQDVGAKYKGDASMKGKLIDKVKQGGKGNWTAVTGGVPMPPYSPRVSDDTIEKLVTFVLSLPE